MLIFVANPHYCAFVWGDRALSGSLVIDPSLGSGIGVILYSPYVLPPFLDLKKLKTEKYKHNARDILPHGGLEVDNQTRYPQGSPGSSGEGHSPERIYPVRSHPVKKNPATNFCTILQRSFYYKFLILQERSFLQNPFIPQFFVSFDEVAGCTKSSA